MTKGIGRSRDELDDERDEGWIDHLFADENRFDGQMMFKLASWGVLSVIAVVVAFLATQAPGNWRRDPASDVALANQTRQLQLAAKDGQNEARRLAAAVDTLNSDRDRLYSRVTVLEQGLDSVTGSIAKPASAAQTTAVSESHATTEKSTTSSSSDAAVASPKNPELPLIPQIAAVKSAPTPSATASATDVPDAAENKIQPTQFGIDIGGANSLEGLRAIWRSALKSNQALLAPLQPIAMMKEGRDGLGMRLRLVAGPFDDAAASAATCAALISSKRPCATSVYDGQRLAMDEPHPAAARKRPKPKTEPAPAAPGVFSSPNG